MGRAFRLRYGSTDLQVTGELVIGRGKDCHLTLEGEGVSRRHAVLRATDEGVHVEDLGSRNGTFVNGKALEAPRSLAHLDRITIGGQELMLVEASRLSSAWGTSSTAFGAATAANQPALGQGFTILVDLARKALAMGDAARAEQVVGQHLEGLLRSVQQGTAVPRDNREQAVALALQLAEARGARWIDWLVGLHTATHALMPADVIDRLHEAVRRHRGASLRLLKAYVADQRARASSLAPAERFRLRRLESLERVVAG